MKAIATVCSNPVCTRNPRLDPIVERESEPSTPAAVDTDVPSPQNPTMTAPPGAIIVLLPNFDEVVIAPGARQLFGRETSNPLIDAALAPFRDVSRAHLVVFNEPDGVFVERRSNGGGIEIEGLPVPDEQNVRTPIELGQRIRMGSVCHLKIVTAKGTR